MSNNKILNLIMLYDIRTFGVLYPEVVLVLVLVCTGGVQLSTIFNAILERLYASDSQIVGFRKSGCIDMSCYLE